MAQDAQRCFQLDEALLKVSDLQNLLTQPSGTHEFPKQMGRNERGRGTGLAKISGLR